MASDLDNAINNAVDRLFHGSDHSTQAAVRSLVNDNIYEQFLYRLLFSSNSIPLQAQWVMLINSFPLGGNLIAELNKYTALPWNIIDGYREGTRSEFHSAANGCIFAQGVGLPGDGIGVTRQGSENTGYLKGLIGSGRKDFQELKTSFLDTNTSFTDFVLRPWSTLVAYKSLKDQGLKSSITVFNLKKTGSGNPLRPRKITTFWNVVPTSIDTEEYNYLGDKIIQRQVSWAYDYYSIETESNTIKDTVFDFIGNATGVRGLDDLGGVIERGITGIFSQAKNTFEGFVNDALSDVATNIRGDVLGPNTGDVSISNVDHITSNSVDSLNISQNDALKFDRVLDGINSIESSLRVENLESKKEVKINEDDTPDTFSLAAETNILPPIDDTSLLSPSLGDLKRQSTLEEVVGDTVFSLRNIPEGRATPNPIDKPTTKAVEGLQKSTAGKSLPLGADPNTGKISERKSTENATEYVDRIMSNAPKIKTGNQNLSINKDDNISGRNSLSKFGRDVKINKNDTASNSIPVKIITTGRDRQSTLDDEVKNTVSKLRDV